MGRNRLVGTAIAGGVATVIGLTGLSVGAVNAMDGSASAEGATVGSSCTRPQLAGTVEKVSLRNMGGSMMGGNTGMMGGYTGMMGGYTGMRMTPRGAMNLSLDRSSVGSGAVSFLATNDGSISHELVILPLANSQVAGSRSISSDSKIDETASLGEASATCKAGKGSGIAPGSIGWVTLNLAPGRYEVVCNLPGHYAAGMYRELNVT